MSFLFVPRLRKLTVMHALCARASPLSCGDTLTALCAREALVTLPNAHAATHPSRVAASKGLLVRIRDSLRLF